MTLAAPIYLLALLAIPLVAAAYALARRRRRRFAVRFPAAAVARRAAASRGWRRVLPAALLAAAAAPLPVAFARPQATVAVPVEKASVCSSPTSRARCRPTTSTRRGSRRRSSAAEKFLDHVPDTLLVGFVGFSSRDQRGRSSRRTTARRVEGGARRPAAPTAAPRPATR